MLALRLLGISMFDTLEKNRAWIWNTKCLWIPPC